MTRRKQATVIGLDPQHKDLVCEVLVKLVLREIEQAKKAIKNKSYFGGSIDLADAGDWVMVLSDISNGTITNLQMLKDRVKSLHTGDEHVCWNLLAEIENAHTKSLNPRESTLKR